MRRADARWRCAYLVRDRGEDGTEFEDDLVWVEGVEEAAAEDKEDEIVGVS